MPDVRGQSGAQVNLEYPVKLLLDQNLSFRIVARLSQVYSGSLAAREVGLARASDREIWAYAAAEQCVVVTKDTDFLDWSFIRGAPPKVIWLACGNCSTEHIVNLLRDNERTIRRFGSDDNAALLTLP